MRDRPPVVLTIAGSDSGGGAGVQADLQTFAALGVHGVCAITALTAQNTRGVRAVSPVAAAFVSRQIEAVAEDFDVAAVKIGMLADAHIVEAVADSLQAHDLGPLVIDPVMVSGSGDRLLDADAVETVRRRLLPLATVLTPNLAESAVLLGLDDPAPGASDADLLDRARRLRSAGAEAVFLKGGHRHGDADDLFVGPEGELVLTAERIPGRVTHGTGCTVSAAIAASLAKGRSCVEAVREAKHFVSGAIAQARMVGGGQATLHWFWEYYGPEGLP